MRYRIVLINTITGERQLSMIGYSSKKLAEEFAVKWANLGEEYGAEVRDTKTNTTVSVY